MNRHCECFEFHSTPRPVIQSTLNHCNFRTNDRGLPTTGRSGTSDDWIRVLWFYLLTDLKKEYFETIL